MRTPLEQSRAYAELGMLEEAPALADKCVSPGGDYDLISGWHVRLAYKSADFARAATLVRNLFPRERQLAIDREYAALTLHHCGQSREAAVLLLELGELGSSSLQNYLAACEATRAAQSTMILRRLRAALVRLQPRQLPQSAFGKALAYTLNQWPALGRFLRDGRIEIDNNLVGNSIRPTALGKKNWPFIGAADAGERGAILYTIVESCRRRGLDPFSYLRDVFTRLPQMTTSQIADVTPEAWTKARKLRPAAREAA